MRVVRTRTRVAGLSTSPRGVSAGGAFGEVRVLFREWIEPEREWLPLRRAVFAFHLERGGEWSYLGQPGLHSITDLLSKNDILEVELNPLNTSFSFSCKTDSGAEILVGTPWTILETPQKAELDPLTEAEALFERSLVHLEDDEAARQKRIVSRIRLVTSILWRRFMLPGFGTGVSSGAVTLFARPQVVTAKFQHLSADLWPILKILDWENGAAVAPDGTAYWSMHAVFPAPKTADESRRAEVARRWAIGQRPGKNIAWKLFCDGVRDVAGGWSRARARQPLRGFSDKMIQRDVQELQADAKR
jgi:hypothetical protein